MSLLLSVLAAAVCACTGTVPDVRDGAAADAAVQYELIYSQSTPRLVQVRATFTLSDSTLAMVPYGAEHLPDGWRTFVRNEQLATAAGAPIRLERLPERKWRAHAPAGERVQLTYDVAIEHDLAPWIPHAREAAYVRPWGVFAVGRALFIYDNATAPEIGVRVQAPRGWSASTAWTPVEGETASYRAQGWGAVINSVIFVGEAERFALREGPVEVQYVVGGPEFGAARPLLEEATSRILRTYLDLFGGTPPSARLLVVINPESDAHGGGGGVFRQSISMTFPQVPSRASIPGWGHTLAHELFHVWNGSALKRGSPAEEWFVEGFADYYAVLTMTRLGYFPQSVWQFKAGNWFSEYERVAGRISLAGAGEQEFRSPGPEMLYSGGASMALALDVALRAGSGRGLDAALAALYAKHGTRGTDVTNAEVLAAANSTGFDAATLFRRHVEGTERIELDAALAQLGFTRASGRVQPVAEPTAAQRAAHAAYFAAPQH